MRTKIQKTELDREVSRLVRDGYTPINPSHNGINEILADIGKSNLSPREVETLCQTAKCTGLNGFVRFDLLPCGCGRVYRGMILGCSQDSQSFNIKIGGIEGIKPCPKHTSLVESIGDKL